MSDASTEPVRPGRVLPATASPLPWRASVVLVAAVVGVTALVGGLLVAVLLLTGGGDLVPTLLAVGLPLHSLAVLATVHVVLRRAGTGWVALGFRRPTARLWHLLWQLPVLLLAALAVQALVLLPLGAAPPADDALADIAGDVGPGLVVALLLTVVVLVPLWEEAVFRGVVQGGLRRRWPLAVAVLGSAALFAAAHGVPVLLPYLLTVGLGLAVLREVHGTLWASVLAHAGNNALASLSLLAVLRG
ncbi:CPBP family intramembrane glutamic endopeptidase [Pseudokineococcus lusitanus]|uniref:CAAX prenyl protease 2/Lysostaphin resistance protein A-like domain-containing protein n=1 Tax=Pseudokineococcus lusitanus TaxID=763993 RepID=A0A3N1HQT4_9ACTN|nr:CPBP family intramembrane glutamic endopeptidase [Pseudokineococcus lusitanus]ROP44867.1 hypothetical protein EDC03_0997 [Pseudokineococcus lusitanus]